MFLTYVKLFSFLIVFNVFFVHQTISTRELFRNFRVTSTTPYTHITSLLKQPRSDSRADKTDEFPGFDFDELEKLQPRRHRLRIRSRLLGVPEETGAIQRPPITRAELYTKLVGNLVGNLGQRLTSAIHNISLPQRLINRRANNNNNKNVGADEEKVPKADDGDRNILGRDDNHRNGDSPTTEFVGLRLEDIEPNVIFEIGGDSTTAQGAAEDKKDDDGAAGSGNTTGFLPTLVKTFGLRRSANNTSFRDHIRMKFHNTTSTLATRLISPLLQLWLRANQNTDSEPSAELEIDNKTSPDEDDMPFSIFNRLRALNDRSVESENIQKIALRQSFPKNIVSNYSNITNDAVEIIKNNSTNDGQFRVNSNETDGNGNHFTDDSLEDGSAGLNEDPTLENWNSDYNDSVENDVRSNKNRIAYANVNLRFDKSFSNDMESGRKFTKTIANEQPFDDDGGSQERLFFNEGLGIYVLEVIGTIAGLTWGAINQLQTFFQPRM